MSVIRVRKMAPADGKLVIDLPEDLRVGEVDVEVRAAQPGAHQPNTDALREVAIRIRNRQQNDPRFHSRTKEQIDEHLRDERESWE